VPKIACSGRRCSPLDVLKGPHPTAGLREPLEVEPGLLGGCLSTFWRRGCDLDVALCGERGVHFRNAPRPAARRHVPGTSAACCSCRRSVFPDLDVGSWVACSRGSIASHVDVVAERSLTSSSQTWRPRERAGVSMYNPSLRGRRASLTAALHQCYTTVPGSLPQNQRRDRHRHTSHATASTCATCLRSAAVVDDSVARDSSPPSGAAPPRAAAPPIVDRLLRFTNLVNCLQYRSYTQTVSHCRRGRFRRA